MRRGVCIVSLTRDERFGVSYFEALVARFDISRNGDARGGCFSPCPCSRSSTPGSLGQRAPPAVLFFLGSRVTGSPWTRAQRGARSLLQPGVETGAFGSRGPDRSSLATDVLQCRSCPGRSSFETPRSARFQVKTLLATHSQQQ